MTRKTESEAVSGVEQFSGLQKMEALTAGICALNAIAAGHRMSADRLRQNLGKFSNATPENIAVYQSNADAIYRHVDALCEMVSEIKGVKHD